MALKQTESLTYSFLTSAIIRSTVQLKGVQKIIQEFSGIATKDSLLEEISGLLKQYRQMEKSVQVLEAERQNFHTLVKTGQLINSSLDLDEVLRVTMDNIIQLTSAERGFLMLRENDGNLNIQVARNWEKETLEEEEISFSSTVISRVVKRNEPVLTTNAQEDPRFFGQESIVAYSLRSIMCVPLILKQELIGVIYADNRLRSGLFTESDLGAFQAFGNQAAIAIENARLFNSLKQSLEEVTELKNLMDSVFNSMASGVMTTDTMQTIQLCNPAASSILASENQQVVGKQMDELFPGLTDIIQYYLKRTIELGITSTGIEVSGDMPERGETDLRFSFSPLVDDDKSVKGVAIVIEDETETRKLKAQRRLFERMVSPAVIDQLDPEHLDLTGKRVELTTLFADIRGFTSFSEKTSPDRLFKLLNLHLAHVVDAVLSEEGTIDKFQGDAVMAWFNAPIQQEDHPMRAIRAALAIQKQVTRFHSGIPTDEQLNFGIGIHVGEAMLGLVGTKQRLEYTAIGDSVNTAKRMQENAKAGQILITENLFRLVKHRINVKPVDPILVKGKQKPLLVYEVLGLK